MKDYNIKLLKLTYSTLFVLHILAISSQISYGQKMYQLDTIVFSKRIALKEFGDNISLPLLSKKMISIHQYGMETDHDFFVMKDQSGKLYRIKKEILSKIENEEFNNYLLSYYSSHLTAHNLREINKIFNTNNGSKIKEALKKAFQNNQPVAENTFKDLDMIVSNESFSKYIMVADQLYDNIEFLLLEYFRAKAK